MRYPFRTSYAPGARRPDLLSILDRHATFVQLGQRIDALFSYASALMLETTPEPAGEYGTFIPYTVDHFLRALDDGDDILRRHRRQAHARWTQTIDPADEAAWMCARAHSGNYSDYEVTQ